MAKAKRKEQTLRQLKDEAFVLAQKLGLKCVSTKHFKKHVGKNLDLRTKDGWSLLFGRLLSLAPLNIYSDFLLA